MITGSEEESRELMIAATIRIVAKNGFEGFRTKSWAREAGVAEGSLYYHFRSKDELLDQSFYFIDHEIAELCAGITLPEHPENSEWCKDKIMEIWDVYYRYMTMHPERTVYYDRFRASSRYTEQIREKQEDGIQRILRQVLEMLPQEKAGAATAELLQVFLMDTTTALAMRAAEGELQENDQNGRMLRMMVEGGIERFCAGYK